MAWDQIPRTHSFSLGDFHDFDKCSFRFFVNHHLLKKYELAEGTPSQALGSLLDLSIKKLHSAKAYNQPVDYLVNLIKAAEVEMRTDALKRGKNSFYGASVEYISPELLEKAKKIFRSYLETKARVNRMVPASTLLGPKPFWKLVIAGEKPLQLWGGPDSIEMGEDGIPEIVDYKYLEKGDEGTGYLDMDLMPKLYTFLCAQELLDLGFTKARFSIRLWHDPANTQFYEEFNLADKNNLEAYFKDKMERILRTVQLSYCGKSFCKVCTHPDKQLWIQELYAHGWIEQLPSLQSAGAETVSGLPF